MVLSFCFNRSHGYIFEFIMLLICFFVLAYTVHSLQGYLALARHQEEIIAVVKLFYGDKRKNVAESIRNRLHLRNRAEITQLIRDSYENRQTRMYDWFQLKSNNIHF